MKRNKYSWFVVMSKPNQEIKAFKKSQKSKLKFFAHIFEKEVLTGKIQKKNKKDFLFPSYIFVRFNLSNCNWVKIRNTYGVKKV